MISRQVLVTLLLFITTFVIMAGYNQISSYVPPHSERTCFETWLPGYDGENFSAPEPRAGIRIFIAVHSNSWTKRSSFITLRYIIEETGEFSDEQSVISFEDLKLSPVISRDCKYE